MFLYEALCNSWETPGQIKLVLWLVAVVVVVVVAVIVVQWDIVRLIGYAIFAPVSHVNMSH